MLATSLKNGIFPFWNPFTFVGTPFFAQIEIAVLYPFNLLLSLFVSNNSLSPLPLQLTIIFHYLMCGIFTFFLGREIKLSNVSALLFSIIFTYSSYMMIHMIHMANIEAVTYLPLVFMLWHRFLRTQKYYNIFIAAFVMGLSVFCGYPQVPFFNYLFISIFLLVVFIYKIKIKEFTSAKNIAIGFVLFAILSISLPAIQLLPSTEFISLSNRAKFDYDFAKQGSVTFLDFITVFVPKVFGVWNWNENSTELQYWSKHSEGSWMFSVSNIYTTALTIIILIPAVTYMIKNNIRKIFVYYFLSFALFVLLFSLGGNFFLHKLLFDFVPFFDRFRNPGHILFLFCFIVSVIASLGFDYFIKDKKIITEKYLYILSGIAILFLILVASGFFKNAEMVKNEQITSWVTKQYVVFFFLLMVNVILIFLFKRNIINLQIFSILIILISFIDVYYIWGQQNLGPDPRKLYSKNSQLSGKLKEELNSEIFRVNMREGRDMLFERNQGMIDKIPLIEGYGALILEKYAPPIKKDSNGVLQSHNLMNVKYKISVDKQKGMNLVPNPGYIPRAKMFYDVKVLQGDTTIRQYMESPEFDYRKTLVIEKIPSGMTLPDLKDTSNQIKSDVKITNYGLNEFSLDVETFENGFLFLSEVYYPAWNAYIDGMQTEVLRADYCLRAIYLTKGKHKVEYKYESSTFSTGWKVSLTSIILIAFGFVITFFQSKKSKLKEKVENTD